MSNTTKSTAVSKRPPAKTASAKPKKGGKKPAFSMMEEIRKEEAGLMTKEVFDQLVDPGKSTDSDDPTSVEYVPEVMIQPVGKTGNGIQVIEGGKKKKRGQGIEPAPHPRDGGVTVVAASALDPAAYKSAKAPIPVAAPTMDNKRITPGTEVKEWRVVKSLRSEFNGWFLQGGLFRKGPRGNQFFVGIEERYLDPKAAREALKSKQVA
jgi:hypothetical protein